MSSRSPQVVRSNSKSRFLIAECVSTVQRPGRVLRLFNRKKMKSYFGQLSMKFKIGNSWTTDEEEVDFRRRSYSTYEDYLAHQKSKLEKLDLGEYDVKFREVLRSRLEQLSFVSPGMSALCLAARLGTEVKAFLDVGCFAVGIDLNPGEENHYVVHGDFHAIQFADHSVDLIYTNSLDHVFDIDGLINEMDRVLKSDGHLIIEAQKVDPSLSLWSYESFSWQSIDSLIHLFELQQFKLVNRAYFDYPWGANGGGEQLCFVKKEE